MIHITEAAGRRLGVPAPAPKRKRKRKATTSLPYPMFEAACAAHHLPIPWREVQFCPGRKWRFDWAWSDPNKSFTTGHKVALEIDGGVWSRGRHTRGKGFIEDQIKQNEAVCRGWKVLRCIPADIESGAVFALLKRVLLYCD